MISLFATPDRRLICFCACAAVAIPLLFIAIGYGICRLI